MQTLLDFFHDSPRICFLIVKMTRQSLQILRLLHTSSSSSSISSAEHSIQSQVTADGTFLPYQFTPFFLYQTTFPTLQMRCLLPRSSRSFRLRRKNLGSLQVPQQLVRRHPPARCHCKAESSGARPESPASRRRPGSQKGGRGNGWSASLKLGIRACPDNVSGKGRRRTLVTGLSR